MTKAKRYISIQLLHQCGVLLRVVYHELWRVSKGTDNDGFTDKEKAFLLKRLNTLDGVCNDLSKLGNHMKAKS